MFANQRSGRFYFKHFFYPKIKIVHTFFASNVCWLEFFVATTDTLDRKSLLNITINFTVQHLIRITLKDINELECLLTDGSIVEWRLQFGIFKSPCCTGPWTEKKKIWLRHGPWLNSLLSYLAVVYFPLQKRNNRNKNND